MDKPEDADERQAALSAALAHAEFGGTQLCTMLLSMEEGIQLWDRSGRRIYVNPATERQFGARAAAPDLDYRVLAGLCLDDQDLSLAEERFPVAQVIAGGQASLGTLVQVAGGSFARRWLRLNAYPLRSAQGTELLAVVSSSVDVTDLIEHGRRLQREAHYDALTLLPNRILLADRLKLAMAHSQRSGDTLAVCLMDLDGFKAINDTLGHRAGDRLLQEVAHRLQDSVRSDDTAARLGGDEFVLLLGGLKSPGQGEQAVKRLLEAVAAPYALDGAALHISGSVGVTLYPADAADADQLLRHADQAMYKAKEAGKNRFVMFDPAVESRLRANQGLLRRIEDALAAGQFSLDYQPQVDCRQGRVVGLEALVRWHHPVLGTRLPGEFLPLIEQDEVIVRLGEWVIERTLEQLAAWRQAGIDLPLSVNVSAQQLLRRGFDGQLADLLARHPPELARRLEIEIVEAAALADINAVGALMGRLQAQGVAFALDDFGTSYSSLVTLRRLPADILKIDRSFIRDMLEDPNDLAIVHGIVGLADAFQHRVVANGVESIEQLLVLLEMGCDVMQGYCLARPMAADSVPAWLRAFRPDPRWRAARSGFPSRTEFELLLLEVFHRHWLARIRASAQGAAETWRMLPAEFEGCRLSQWSAQAGNRRFGALAEYQELERAHRQVHRLAVDLKARLAAGEKEPAAAAERQLAAANEDLVGRLGGLRRTLARTEGGESAPRTGTEKDWRSP